MPRVQRLTLGPTLNPVCRPFKKFSRPALRRPTARWCCERVPKRRRVVFLPIIRRKRTERCEQLFRKAKERPRSRATSRTLSGDAGDALDLPVRYRPTMAICVFFVFFSLPLSKRRNSRSPALAGVVVRRGASARTRAASGANDLRYIRSAIFRDFEKRREARSSFPNHFSKRGRFFKRVLPSCEKASKGLFPRRARLPKASSRAERGASSAGTTGAICDSRCFLEWV